MSLPLRLKLFVIGGVLTSLVAIFGIVLPLKFDSHPTEYFAISDLKNAVNVQQLSTVDYIYHGIADKKGSMFWQEVVDFRIRYEAQVRAHYDLNKIEFTMDEKAKKITAYIPEPTISEPVINENKFGFLPENIQANMKEILALCKEDAARDVDKKAIKEQADYNLKDTIKALVMPFTGDDKGWNIEFKNLSELSQKGAKNDAKNEV